MARRCCRCHRRGCGRRCRRRRRHRRHRRWDRRRRRCRPPPLRFSETAGQGLDNH